MTHVQHNIINNTDEDENHQNITSGEDDGFDFPDDYDVCEMLNEVPLDIELQTVTDRYFTPYYKVNVQKSRDDLCIRVHSNRICMLSLAPSHAILQESCKIQSISFKVTEKLDRAANKVKGKGKHGAQPLQETSNICIITCANGETWSIKCCISGKLIEVNEALLENPELIREPPHKGGYLAIILPSIAAHEKMSKTLLTEKDYQMAIIESKDVDISNKTDNACKRARDRSLSPQREGKIQKQCSPDVCVA